MEFQKAICRSVPFFSSKGKKILILRDLMKMFIPLILFYSNRTICMASLACMVLAAPNPQPQQVPLVAPVTPTMETTLGATSVGGRGPATSTPRQLMRLGISGSAWRPPRLSWTLLRVRPLPLG